MAILDLSFESGEQSLSVRHFSVHEGISTLFSANVVARSPKEDIDLESLVGKAGGLLAIGNLAVPRGWTGVVSHAEQIDVEPPTGTSLGLSTYLVRIVPTLWLLTQRRGYRIYQHLSIPDIVDRPRRVERRGEVGDRSGRTPSSSTRCSTARPISRS